METRRFVILPELAGGRFDKALSDLDSDLTRSRAQSLIKDGRVSLNGLVCRDVSRKLLAGEVMVVEFPEAAPAEPQPEDIPLDIVYEDDDLLVINKPAGLVVHPGAGNVSGTLVNALLHHCAGSLSGIGGVARPGIVHRLDKDTSGLMVAAKNDKAHQGLAAQLEDRSLSRVYQALVLGVPMPPQGVIDQPMGRDPHNRLKMVIRRRGGKDARTHYRTEKTYGGACTLVECRLESGRTHQIRVHMASIKHPLIGDLLYGPQPTAVQSALKKGGYDEAVVQACLDFPRQALHARQISFIHPVSGSLCLSRYLHLRICITY